MPDADRVYDTGPKAKIFISYSRKDMAFADWLDTALRRRGFEPLIDRTEIYAFEDWWKRIQRLLGKADTVVFVLSPDAVKSDVALKEVEYAASLNKRFAPIVFRRVDHNVVPKPLRRLNFIFFDEPNHFEANADQLAVALKTDINWIRRDTEFGEAARRWMEQGRPAGLLLRSPLLDQAETWLALRPADAPPPTFETEAFLAESRKADTESKIADARVKRRWRLAQAAIYILFVGIILGLFGWINQAYLLEQWRWYATVQPFMRAKVRPYVLSATAEQALKPKDIFRECTTDDSKDYCPELVVIPAGSFMMGAPPGQQDSPPNPILAFLTSASPQHEVTIERPFAVAKFAVTFDEWDTCVAFGDCVQGISDSGFGRGRRPVINLSWEEAKSYVAWLSKMTGKPYGLLSEAEYEYATRAGTQSLYPWGEDIGRNNANCGECGSKWDKKETTPVGSFPANGFGLHDMVGNAWEWVEDCYHPDYQGAPMDGSAWMTECVDGHRHVIRGGSYLTQAGRLRSDSRFGGTTVLNNYGPGFRVARTLTQ
jgi:formylglycine-generating enzyme required for sulfatase activity